MRCLLGVDTGGTFTDAVLLDEGETALVAAAKRLTTRPDLSVGIGAAVDAVLAEARLGPEAVAMVALSTTLATNALVEGQGGRVALVLAGFEAADLGRDGLGAALGGDPAILIRGGHDAAGGEAAPLDLPALEAGLAALPAGIGAVAVAARFATRNPAHERALRALVRARTGLPVTCSHELSAGLGGPRRALTALLNARLIGMIDRLIAAAEGHLARRGIAAPLMVVRGDGALIPAAMARERPVETILSGPAASAAGAAWLTGLKDALVADIGGTTTDVCVLRGGRPAIDPGGATVGGHRTMVEAVAMRTSALGGDSAIALAPGLGGGLRLGPGRVVPVALMAAEAPGMVHAALDAALSADPVPEEAGRFARALFAALPEGLDPREAAVAARLPSGPRPLAEVIRARVEGPALARLVARGLVQIAGPTPTDAAHVLGLARDWDAAAAEKAMTLLARMRDARGERLAPGPREMAARVVAALREASAEAMLAAAVAAEAADWGGPPESVARHPLMRAALGGHRGVLRLSAGLDLPVIGLGAGAAAWYPPLAEVLGTAMHLPEAGGVANAIGAVVGRVELSVAGSVTLEGPGRWIAHGPAGPRPHAEAEEAVAALAALLAGEAAARARAAGVADPAVTVAEERQQAEVEGRPLLVEAQLRATARGRPALARAAAPG